MVKHRPFYPLPDLVSHVKEYATEHYDTGGWDIVIETMTDDDIQRMIQGHGIEGKARVRTPKSAVRRVAQVVGIVDEARAEVIAEGDIVEVALDSVECEKCGAQSGQACQTPSGQPTAPHKARVIAFEAVAA